MRLPRLPNRVRLRHNLLLLGLSIVVSLLVLEFGLRAYDSVRGYGFFSARRNELAVAPRPLRPFRTFGYDLYQIRDGVTYVSSRHGELYPLEKPDSTVRIVAFGGSTTANHRTFNEHGVHYPSLLQEALRSRSTMNIEVINVAHSGYATGHALVVLALDVLSWDPDIVILSHNFNDRLAMYWADFQPDYSHMFSHPFFSVPDYRSRYTVANILFQHSQLYWVVKDKLARMFDDQDFPPMQRRSYGATPTAVAVEVFERNLQSFVTVAKTGGIDVLLATQSLEPSVEWPAQLQPYNDAVTYPLHDEHVAHHAFYNDVIAKVAEETGVWFLDNDAALGGRREYFADLMHYTLRGVEALAENYARFLVDQGVGQ